MHILINGASKGIGLAIAKKFAALGGVKLSVCSRHESDLDSIRAALESVTLNVPVLAVACDVSQESAVNHFMSLAEQTFGPVDVLINNAGFGRFSTVLEMKTEDFDSQIATNLRGVFLVTQAALPGMKLRRAGTIVTISSLAGKAGFPGGAGYCSSKFGVRGLMQSLFLDVREFGLRVITLFPGSVDTAFFNSGSGAGALRAKKALQPKDIAEAVFAAVTLRSHATVSEIEIRPTNPKG